MLSSIVVVTGFGPGHERALAAGAALARRGQIPVDVLTGVDCTKPFDRAAAQAVLTRHGLADRLDVVEGDDVPAAVFGRVAGRQGSLVVMTATSRGIVSERRHGSLTATLLHELRHPVLVLGPEVASLTRLDTSTLVACTDRAHDPTPLVSVVARWQDVFGGHQPWLVHVVPPAGWPAGSISDAVEHEHLDAVAAELRGRDVDTTRRLVHGGDPVPAIVDLVTGIGDAVCVTSSERWVGSRSHWYSTTRRLVQQLPRPVLVVPADLDDR